MNYKKFISGCMPGKSSGTNSTAAVALALAGGIILGSVVALLFAPSSGEETREKIKDGARDLANGAKDKFETLKQKVSSGKEQLADNISSKYNNLKN